MASTHTLPNRVGMARSRCPGCAFKRFELEPVQASRHGVELKGFYFVQCRRCGAVVGLIETNGVDRHAEVVGLLKAIVRPDAESTASATKGDGTE